MDPSQRQSLFEQLKIVIPDDFLPVLELAVKQGYVSQGQISRCLTGGNGRGVPIGLRHLLHRLDIPIQRDQTSAARGQPKRLARMMEKDQDDGRRPLHGVAACLASLCRHHYPTKAQHLAMAREMEDQQRTVLDILLRFPPLAAEFDAWVRANSNGYQPKAKGRRLGFSIKRRERHEWWPLALKQLKQLYDLKERHAGLERLWRDDSNPNVKQRRNYRRQLRRLEQSLGCDGQGLVAAIQAVNQALERYVPLRAEMITRNGRLTVSIAKRRYSEQLDLEDRISEGSRGLIIAVDRYDWRRGYNLSTYATWWIRQAISRAIADQDRTVRVPVHQIEAIYKAARVRRKLDFRLGRFATDEEVAAALDTPVEKVEDLLRYGQSILSLDRTIDEDGETSLVDVLPDLCATDPNIIVANRLLREAEERLLDELTKREARVIRLRFGLTEDGIPRTLEEVGAFFNVTRERIRQIEAKALRKLRHPTRRRRLIGFHENRDQTLSPSNLSIRPA
ncbi:MAG: sigma-70 family RNA polymerase sigma factor [Patescibacteria group bacterium]|nr:sigma-70 family RNA polymerase sigma factor [Patescibacteria group bacterium]